MEVMDLDFEVSYGKRTLLAESIFGCVRRERLRCMTCQAVSDRLMIDTTIILELPDQKHVVSLETLWELGQFRSELALAFGGQVLSAPKAVWRQSRAAIFLGEGASRIMPHATEGLATSPSWYGRGH